MRAAMKIPKSPPPTLPHPELWTAEFHEFVALCLQKDFNGRPSAAALLKHPFITKAKTELVLMDMVEESIKALEAKEEVFEGPIVPGHGRKTKKKTARIAGTNRSTGPPPPSNHNQMVPPGLDFGPPPNGTLRAPPNYNGGADDAAASHDETRRKL
jgi:serine/threonine protein kinase